MLSVYLAIVYACCVLGTLFELGRRLVLLDLQVQDLERKVCRLIRLGDVCERLLQGATVDPMDVFALALVPEHSIDPVDVYKNALVPKDADVFGLSGLNAPDLYERLERLWGFIQTYGVDGECGDGEGGREGEVRDEKLRRRNVVAVARDMGCTDG